MKVEIDRDRCEGHGMCEEAAPDIFRLDHEGVAQVLIPDVPTEMEAKAAAAARACPVAAIRTTA